MDSLANIHHILSTLVSSSWNVRTLHDFAMLLLIESFTDLKLPFLVDFGILNESYLVFR